MNQLSKFIIKQFLFWMVLFFIQRTTFIIIHSAKMGKIGLFDFILLNWHSFPLDISTFCYIISIPVFLLLINTTFNLRFVTVFIKSYFVLLIVVSSLINMIDLGLYNDWGSKINNKAISYLAYPKEAFASMGSSPVFLLFSVFIITTFLSVWIFVKKFKTPQKIKLRYYQYFLFLIIFFPLLIIGLRGGVQHYPINKSRAYFSTNPVLNQAAANSCWNCLFVLTKPDNLKQNPYNYFEIGEAQQIVNQIHHVEKDSTTSIFSIARPNIIVIMLESFSADAAGIYGYKDNVTPQFDKLASEGLIFTNFYASGFRTEQGIAALISGFPSQPLTTVIRKFGKFEHLPSFVQVLHSNDYHTSFYYGGDLYFANTEAYLESSGFEKLIDIDQFDVKHRTKWGIYDEQLLEYMANDLKNNPEPFFSSTITLINHEPFDAEVERIYSGNSIVDDFRNTLFYTDKCLGQFFENIKNEPWFKNTIFIITGDHAHKMPYDRKHYEYKRHWIPFVIYGDPLKKEYRGKTYERICTQADFPATILAQLGFDYNQFSWSKNIFNPFEPGFAFYTFDDGIGWITPEQIITYSHKADKILYINNSLVPESENSTCLRNAKASLQLLMHEYINFNN